MPRRTAAALALSSVIVAGPALSTRALHSQPTALPSACDRDDARGYDEDWDTSTDLALSPRTPGGGYFGRFENPALDEPPADRPPRRDPTPPRRDDADHCYRWNRPTR